MVEFSAYEILKQLAKEGGYRLLKYEVDGIIHNYFVAYQGKDKKGLPAYWTGGLSALEGAFSVLGWKDPYPCPENKCKYGKCKEWATCGTPTKNGYKRVCFKHYQIIEKEEKSG